MGDILLKDFAATGETASASENIHVQSRLNKHILKVRDGNLMRAIKTINRYDR